MTISGRADQATPETTLGLRIAMAREALGLAPVEAAHRLGVQVETWNAWESDSDKPRPNRLVMMAGLLGVGLTWLMAGMGPAPTPRNQEDDASDVLRDLEAASAEAFQSQQRVQALVNRLRNEAPPPRGSSAQVVMEG
ncbi:transcriptional regulator with XRE-family HTH domain [Rhodoligotrophos appendicifer]|uniref:helix-turn-helix domain-containing protein n=1 Tax=Rhodoligotrophos appendicifer TaxID=987056 RepID=UPI0011861D80|nr:helix-turn-helix transcriptional regulator [Rhodoligotrophos appendicifer]